GPPGGVPPRREPAPGPVAAPPAPRRRFAWATLFWSALGGLVTLGLGLAVTKLIEDLYARTPWLGWVGLALAAVAAVALIAVLVREAAGLARLHAVEKLRARAAAAAAADDRAEARAVVRGLLAITHAQPRLARARAALAAHLADILDGADLVR